MGEVELAQHSVPEVRRAGLRGDDDGQPRQFLLSEYGTWAFQ